MFVIGETLVIGFVGNGSRFVFCMHGVVGDRESPLPSLASKQ